MSTAGLGAGELPLPKLIGVSNTPPLYALGLAGALSGDRFDVQVADDATIWMRRNGGAALIVGIGRERDFDIVVDLMTENPDRVIITLVDGLDLLSLQASLQAGATAVIDFAAKPDEISVVLEGALLDKAVLPLELARDLTPAIAAQGACPTLSDSELSMLRGLAGGLTVAELGRRIGYSDREIYRKLHAIYRKLGVKRRVDALLKASRWGLLDQ
jgi:DNA-binding NarL/FixJ family response regulator